MDFFWPAAFQICDAAILILQEIKISITSDLQRCHKKNFEEILTYQGEPNKHGFKALSLHQVITLINALPTRQEALISGINS